MFEIPTLDDEDLHYDGSKIFTWLATWVGLSVDLVSKMIREQEKSR